MKETELNKVLNYMKQYVENKYEHDSEPMLTYKDLQLVLDELERLNNIITELERHLEQQWLEWKDCETDVRFMANEDKCILEKLRELKGDSNE